MEIKVYSGRGRPPTDPQQRILWEKARAERLLAKIAEKEGKAQKKRKLVAAASRAAVATPKKRRPKAAPVTPIALAPKPSPEKDNLSSSRQGAEANFRRPIPPAAADVKGNLLRMPDLPEIIDLMKSKRLRSLTVNGLRLQAEFLEEAPTEAPRDQVASPQEPPRHSERLTASLDQEVLEDVEHTQKLIDDPLGYEQDRIDAEMGIGTHGVARVAAAHDREVESHL